ncbi:MAG: hypothetical protein RID53_03295 [Coleofasciculus sp. B1-GNL1-01]|uniref:hypothetical protein n=1 Tax=Coleofasciculus sp. B1-GNL1-01 TaxID=3068484 RepID=UPI003304D48B
METQHLSLNTTQMSDFQQWKQINGDDFSLWDYLAGVSNIEVALAFTKVFLPDFVEHEGGIFLSEAFNLEIYEQWKAQLGDNIASIEQVMNHQHIDDLLPGSESAGIDNLFYLGQVIKQMWKNHLKSLYPKYSFEVSCTRDEYTVVVTFHHSKREELQIKPKKDLQSSDKSYEILSLGG